MREAQMSLSISKLVDVSRKRLPILTVSLTSLLLLNSLCFPGQIPDSLDSGLTEKCGQLRTIAAIIRLSIHEEAANSVTHLALHVPVRFLPDPKVGQRVLLRPGERRPPHCLCSCVIRGAWDLHPGRLTLFMNNDGRAVAGSPALPHVDTSTFQPIGNGSHFVH